MVVRGHLLQPIKAASFFPHLFPISVNGMEVDEVSKMTSGLSTDRALRKLFLQLQSLRIHNEIYAKPRWKDYHRFTPIPYLLTYTLIALSFVIFIIILSLRMPLCLS